MADDTTPPLPVFKPEDVLPVPCHPDALAMAYALRSEKGLVPLTGLIDPQILIEGGRNTIVYEHDASLRDHLFKLFATNHSPASAATDIRVVGHSIRLVTPSINRTVGRLTW